MSKEQNERIAQFTTILREHISQAATFIQAAYLGINEATPDFEKVMESMDLATDPFCDACEILRANRTLNEKAKVKL